MAKTSSNRHAIHNRISLLIMLTGFIIGMFDNLSVVRADNELAFLTDGLSGGNDNPMAQMISDFTEAMGDTLKDHDIAEETMTLLDYMNTDEWFDICERGTKQEFIDAFGM